MKTWFTITNKADSAAAEIDIFDEIGLWGVSTKDFANALKSVPADREISLRINSPGGSVFDGFAIFDMLAARRDKVTARVIGVAASMASIIALAGKRTIAAENAVLMIHKPHGGAYGESDEMRKMADLLDKIEGRLVNVYVAKTGKSEADVRAALEATTWFTAEEAKAWGLVDEIAAPVKAAASFDLSRFGALPKNLTGGGDASTNHQQPKQMIKLLAVLVEAKLLASADVNEDAAVAQVRAAFANQAAQLKAASDENADLKAKLETANKSLTEALKARAESAIEAAVKAGKIKDDAAVRAKWVEAYIANEDAAKMLIASLTEQKLPRGGAPVSHVPAGTSQPGNKAERPSTESVWARQFQK